MDNIPNDILKLLYISDAEPQGFGLSDLLNFTINFDTCEIKIKDTPDDPSTIYTKCRVSTDKNLQNINSPDYYPYYSGLTPEQRSIYLRWLSDIYQPTEISYVFLFFYGLERKLLLENFDDAFNMIMTLRKVYDNDSFDYYSLNSLIYSAVLKNRPDKMEDLVFILEDDVWKNEQLLLCYYLNKEISYHQLASVFLGLSEFNRRYIKNNRDIYDTSLKAVLTDYYNHDYLILKKYFPLEKVQKHSKIIFANYKFPQEVRSPQVRDYTKDAHFLNKMKGIHQEAHEMTKNTLKELRKKKKTTK